MKQHLYKEHTSMKEHRAHSMGITERSLSSLTGDQNYKSWLVKIHLTLGTSIIYH